MNSKWVLLIAVALLFSSCYNDEEEKVQILSAKVNGEEMQYIGNLYRYSDIKNHETVGFTYHLFSNETPNIFIEARDSSFVRAHFDFSSLKASYSYNDSLGNSKLYDAIDGELSITKEKDEILYGNFSFTFVNTRDRADTIRMSDGYYEVTMEKSNRYL
jgi:hypothetical protein